MKYSSIHARSGKSDKTANIYAIATNGFHDELFNDNKEAEVKENSGPDVFGIKQRNRKQSNNVQAIEGLIATVEEKNEKDNGS